MTTNLNDDSSLRAMGRDMAVKALTKDPAFIMGMEHVNEGETELAKTQRFKRLATKLGVDVETLTAAKEAAPRFGALVRNTKNGYYRLTRDIPNPFYDKRVSDRDLNSVEVIPAGCMIAVEHMPPRKKSQASVDALRATGLTDEQIAAVLDSDFHMPRIEIFGVPGKFEQALQIEMVLSNIEPAPVVNLKDAVRCDDIEDYRFKEMVMRLLDQGRLSLDEVRGMHHEMKKMTEAEDTAFYARHGFNYGT
jgi:hypothetical protein